LLNGIKLAKIYLRSPELMLQNEWSQICYNSLYLLLSRCNL